MDVLKRILAPLLLVVLLVAAVAAEASREYQIKAAFLYNFMSYIEWPGPRDTWTVGLLGDDPFEGFLQKLENKPLNGKKVVVRFVKNAKDAKGCDVLFISSSEAARLDPLMASLKGSPILTISDIPSFVEKGGAIGFTSERNRVRFYINTEALQQSELKASANLLKLAIVKGG